MLIKNNTYTKEKETYWEYIKESIKFNCYYIKANDLKKITGLTTKEIDDLILNNSDIPISKHRKIKMGISQFYYVFPIELIIASFFETMTTPLE